MFLDNDIVQFRAMDPEVIEKAIADKTLGGEFELTRSGKKRRPIITAAPQAIARYLEAHGDECYPAKEENTLIWKRQK